MGWKIFAFETLKPVDTYLLPLPEYFEPDELMIQEEQVVSSLEDSFPEFVGFERYIPTIWNEMEKLIDPETNRVKEGYWDKVNRFDKDAAMLVGYRQYPHTRNKGLNLGGYPGWCNGPDETPKCVECESSMELLLQISPTQIVHANWGDVWTPYIFYCPKHKEQFGLCFQGT